jgi:hypothetical protein
LDFFSYAAGREFLHFTAKKINTTYGLCGPMLWSPKKWRCKMRGLSLCDPLKSCADIVSPYNSRSDKRNAIISIVVPTVISIAVLIFKAKAFPVAVMQGAIIGAVHLVVNFFLSSNSQNNSIPLSGMILVALMVLKRSMEMVTLAAAALLTSTVLTLALFGTVCLIKSKKREVVDDCC